MSTQVAKGHQASGDTPREHWDKITIEASLQTKTVVLQGNGREYKLYGRFGLGHLTAYEDMKTFKYQNVFFCIYGYADKLEAFR